MEGRHTLILNAYFPTDAKNDVADTTDLLTTLVGIQNIIRDNEFTELIWTGDINTDFKRKTKFVDTVRNFVNDKYLVKSWEQFQIDFTHACDLGDTTHTSVIDHFFWNVNLGTHVIDAGVLHLTGNFSDHSPDIWPE